MNIWSVGMKYFCAGVGAGVVAAQLRSQSTVNSEHCVSPGLLTPHQGEPST